MAYINGNEVNDTIIVRRIGQNYSTNEQVIGKWINGKPIYQKTLAFTLDNDGYYNNDTDFTEVDQMLDFKGFVNANYGGDNATVAINSDFRFVSNANAFNNLMAYFVKESTEETGLVIVGNKGTSGDFTFANKSGYITVQYTKTTDTATA
jgi:hypothetical protein